MVVGFLLPAGMDPETSSVPSRDAVCIFVTLQMSSRRSVASQASAFTRQPQGSHFAMRIRHVSATTERLYKHPLFLYLHLASTRSHLPHYSLLTRLTQACAHTSGKRLNTSTTTKDYIVVLQHGRATGKTSTVCNLFPNEDVLKIHQLTKSQPRHDYHNRFLRW